MPIYTPAVRILKEMLGPIEAIQIVRMAQEVEKQESRNRRRIEKAMREIEKQALRDLEESGYIHKATMIALDEAMMRNWYETTSKALKETQRQRKPHRLAKLPKGTVPTSLERIKELWDQWRKKKKMTPREKVLSDRVKRQYIQKVQDVWTRYSEDYRKGDEFTQKEIQRKIAEAGKMSTARAQTVANTETTRYWNQARKEVYDRSPDVTHYLFMAIRDARTTAWCSQRHGLVYEKGQDVTQREQPPIHWNCRSEIVPLTPTNSKHRELIEDPRIQRDHHHPKPLPAGWNR